MFATRASTGSSAGVTQTLCGPQRLHDPPRDDRLLLAVLRRAQQLLAEVVVDGGVGAAARRARERERAGAQALAAHQQLGAGGDERRVAAPDGEDVAPGNASRSTPSTRGRRRAARGRVHLHLAREHDLVELARRGSARRRARRRPRSARAASR